MATPEEIVERAQDISGTLTPAEVQTRVGELLGMMTEPEKINLDPISNSQKFDSRILKNYWGVFRSLVPAHTLGAVYLSQGPIPYTFKDNIMKTAWGFGLHLKKGKKFPLVVFNAFNEAGKRIGYNPFFWDFNTETPFAEDWANRQVKAEYPKQQTF